MQAVEKTLKTGLALRREAMALAAEEFQESLKRSSRIYDLKLIRADEEAFKPSECCKLDM